MKGVKDDAKNWKGERERNITGMGGMENRGRREKRGRGSKNFSNGRTCMGGKMRRNKRTLNTGMRRKRKW